MSGVPESVWLVASGVALLQLLGGTGFLLASRGRFVAFSLASGLLWGTAAYGTVATALVFLRHALSIAPLYSVDAVAIVLVVTTVASIVALQRHGTAWGIQAPPVLALQLAAAAVAFGLARLAVALDFSTLSPDSLSMIEAGLALARIDDPAFVGLGFLAGRAPLGPLLHAPFASAGFDFSWFASPLLGLACMASLMVGAREAISRLGGSHSAAVWSVGLGSLWLLGCYFWTYQFVFVHVNLLAAAMLLLFFHTAWLAMVEEDDRWLVLAGAALLAFQLVRVEGALFGALVVGILVLERASLGRRQAPELWLILPGALLSALLAGAIEGGGGIIGSRGQLLQASLLLGCAPLGFVARRRGIARWRERLPAAAMLALALVLLALVVLEPAHMLRRGGIFAYNAIAVGLWSTAWVLVPTLALASPVLGRVPHQRFVQLGLTAWLLGIACLTYAGYWRQGWWDSGNRMLTHLLPTFAWLGMLRAAAIVPAVGAPDPESTSPPPT